MCMTGAEAANCVAGGKAKVKGAPNAASDIESNINGAIDGLGDTMCDSINSWFSAFVPYCLRVS